MSHINIARFLILALSSLSLAAGAIPATAAESSGITRHADVRMPADPIRSQTQLDVYIRETPSSRSPLDWLSPAARSRFLDGISFDQRGVRRMYLDDLGYELDRKQIYALLHLFGAQAYSLDMSARTMPRSAQPGTLEPAFNQLTGAADHPDEVENIYATAFAPARVGEGRHALNDRDVEFLFRAAARAFRITGKPGYLADMQADFAELRQRQLADRPHASELQEAFLIDGEADKAKALLKAYPLIRHGTAPVMQTVGRVHHGQPSLWVAGTDSRTRELLRFPFYIRARAQVLVLASASCPFSRQAAEAIEAQPEIRKIFRDSAQWVAPEDELTAFDAILAWNNAYPSSRLGVIHDNAELPMVRRPETPTFYFMDHGRVVDTVAGWPDGGNMAALRHGLEEIGLLR